MDIKNGKLLYHLTHIDNLDSIIEYGLLSRNLACDLIAMDVADSEILEKRQFNRLDDFVGFSRIAMNVVRAAFALSILYNIVGLGLASTGNLSPMYAAVFMPLSSMSVVLFAVGCTYMFAKIKKLV